MSWWYYATGTEKALIVIGVAALALLAIIIASPYVKPLQAVTARLGLMRTETVYVPINHTVYVNKTVVKYVYLNRTITVPVYINRTVYVAMLNNALLSSIESIAGKCAGDMVILPNNTAWVVFIWLAPKDYVETNPLVNYLFNNAFAKANIAYYNSTSGYAQGVTGMNPLFIFTSPVSTGLIGSAECFVTNVTVNNYYVWVCGDTSGYGPSFFSDYGPSYIITINGTFAEEAPIGLSSPLLIGNYTPILSPYYYAYEYPFMNTTYTGIMIIQAPMKGLTYSALGPICNMTIIYASNPQAALYIKLPREYFNYLCESGIPVFGYCTPIGQYIGYWVWNYPN